MGNDYEINVIIHEHSTYWAWKIEYLGQFVASGPAASIERALRLAREHAHETGYEFERLKLIKKYESQGKGMRLLYGADLKKEAQ